MKKKDMYSELKDFCSNNKITLVVVSKTRPIAVIENLYNQGQIIFGENRVPELQEKYNSLPKDINWHMIGHLQSNKVKYIASFVKMIHSGSSQSLLKEINKQAKKNDRIIEVLLQIKIGKEATKSGWDADELNDTLARNGLKDYHNIKVRGVMGMATFTRDESVIRSEFSQLKSIYSELKSSYYNEEIDFDTISMGMSGDYKIAAEEGSTMVRIGSLLFQ